MPTKPPPAASDSSHTPAAAAAVAAPVGAIGGAALHADDTAPPAAIARLQRLIGGPRDNALLHHAIGVEWLKLGGARQAAEALRAATSRDASFSAAWKLLGKALSDCGDTTGAGEAWRHGIVAAEARGDVQAAKEMRVFLRRLERAGPAG